MSPLRIGLTTANGVLKLLAKVREAPGRAVLGVMKDGVAAMPCLLSTVVAARNLVSA
jgi:hypothetical protein